MANAKRPQGLVVEVDLKKGRSFALRFRAYGERRYLTLGFDSEGWTPEKAQEELDNILADVRRGIWIPPKKSKKADREEQGGGSAPEEPALFGPFATELIAARRGQVAEKTTGFEEKGPPSQCSRLRPCLVSRREPASLPGLLRCAAGVVPQ